MAVIIRNACNSVNVGRISNSQVKQYICICLIQDEYNFLYDIDMNNIVSRTARIFIKFIKKNRPAVKLNGKIQELATSFFIFAAHLQCNSFSLRILTNN